MLDGQNVPAFGGRLSLVGPDMQISCIGSPENLRQ
jgi:hypothetical protein